MEEREARDEPQDDRADADRQQIFPREMAKPPAPPGPCAGAVRSLFDSPMNKLCCVFRTALKFRRSCVVSAACAVT
jgi:hypothetical protein